MLFWKLTYELNILFYFLIEKLFFLILSFFFFHIKNLFINSILNSFRNLIFEFKIEIIFINFCLFSKYFFTKKAFFSILMSKFRIYLH